MDCAIRPAMGSSAEAASSDHTSQRAHRTSLGDHGFSMLSFLRAPPWIGSRKLAPLGEGRRDPVAWIDGLDHSPTVFVFAQNELHELIARSEESEPEPAVTRGRDAPRIGWQVREHGLWRTNRFFLEGPGCDVAKPPTRTIGRRPRGRDRWEKRGSYQSASRSHWVRTNRSAKGFQLSHVP